MGMAHSTSGRHDFTYHTLLSFIDRPRSFAELEELVANNPKFRAEFIRLKTQLQTPFIPKSLVKKMLLRENELRLSPEIQAEYEQAEQSSTTSWLRVTDALQRRIVTEFHLEEEMEEALTCFRCATQIYPDLKDIPLYVVNNRARNGELKEGDVIPDVPVYSLDGKKYTLYEFMSKVETTPPTPVSLPVQTVQVNGATEQPIATTEENKEVTKVEQPIDPSLPTVLVSGSYS
eukprot:TRINITY_DN3471_c0_g1_i2.p1 TRINITY_DN3471_c0_g1~~TRINITY_DN3471_c0_g1_i2.p1  ORF type:complete len:232 (+),score=61.42 TRINITY_DN3471_c0_g1_i2:323-1018(+)